MKPDSGPTGLFELPGSQRILAMEGLRGIAVGLVFMQHYCRQFIAYSDLSGPTLGFARFFREFGNDGVDLFFVLSGYLIYGILLRTTPSFLTFMTRRAQRLYPAFLVVMVIAVLADFIRPSVGALPKIPRDVFDGANYILANLAFLPGLFPIDALFNVNWSLSYEWWFYAALTGMFAVFRLGEHSRGKRISFIAVLAAMLLSFSATGLPHVPVRALGFFAGMLLVETGSEGSPLLFSLGGVLTIVVLTYLARITVSLPTWISVAVLACCTYVLVSSALRQTFLAQVLSWAPLRWFGNISYSYYLIHGFAVLIVTRPLLHLAQGLAPNVVFWTLLIPTFAGSFCFGAALFLAVEKPFSLRPKRRSRGANAMSAEVGTSTQDRPSPIT